MTTIRQKKELRRYIDHATPDDRLRHSAGMGDAEGCQGRTPEQVEKSTTAAAICFGALLVMLAIYAAAKLIVWAMP